MEYDLIKEEPTTLKKINIRNIKSAYIIRYLFSFINIKQKLNLIIYNKQLRKIIGVDIEDYKETSGKYKIAEKNGKGREYILNTNILIFEGEYLNGKRNGEGKEYSDGKLEFEGEYLNGKRNGKGKEYYFDGKLKFDGEYLNGKRNRKGKEYYSYYSDDKLKFDGEYLNGKIWNGKGYNINGNT